MGGIRGYLIVVVAVVVVIVVRSKGEGTALDVNFLKGLEEKGAQTKALLFVLLFSRFFLCCIPVSFWFGSVRFGLFWLRFCLVDGRAFVYRASAFCFVVGCFRVAWLLCFVSWLWS